MIRILFAVFLMALVTYIPRVMPLAMVKSKIKSTFFKSFLYYVPFAVLGAMTFPAIFYSTSNIYSGIFGTLLAVLLSYYEKSLMKVATFAVLGVYVFESLF